MTDMRAELLAEIGRREEIARASNRQNPSPWTLDATGADYIRDATREMAVSSKCWETDRHILANDPSTVLRQLAGVRAVVKMHERDPGIVSNDDGFCRLCLTTARYAPAFLDQEPYPCPTISALYDAFCGGGDD